ncbi:hypothetical protein [Roseovarius sp. MMSF_3281]|uniref:hypothetical protein n=1 Tax=Roseovarius sp. MMSF_3281 TaxID=3046694 RepID=UPI003531B129
MGLSGCAGESVWAPDEEVTRAAYDHDGPPRLTLYTMLNNSTGAGAHTALMVNGSQRVIFDPAGSFNKSNVLPERNDVLFGITPQVEDVYTRYHARETFRVKVQKLDVSPEVARRTEQAVMNYGAVPQAMCANSTSDILAGIFPGQVTKTWSPRKLSEQFAQLPGTTERVLREYDSDDNSKVLDDWDPERVARAAN